MVRVPLATADPRIAWFLIIRLMTGSMFAENKFLRAQVEIGFQKGKDDMKLQMKLYPQCEVVDKENAASQES